MWTRVLVVATIAVLGAPLLVAGCTLPAAETCTLDALRCNGSVLEHCTGHPGGLTGEAPGEVHHDKGSAPTWDTVVDCGADRCVTPLSGLPFCALDPSKPPACSGDAGVACAGNSLIECKAGYLVERELCKSCDMSAGCSGGHGDACESDADCAPGLTCALDRAPASCELACTCPEGTACASCDVLLESAPDGKASVWVCSTGRCTLTFP